MITFNAWNLGMNDSQILTGVKMLPFSRPGVMNGAWLIAYWAVGLTGMIPFNNDIDTGRFLIKENLVDEPWLFDA